MRLLLVEDEIDIQTFLRRSLEEAGYQVETAPDGKTALRLATEGPFDILIVDLGLPDQDGISLILKLRQLGIVAPVLILSARRSVDDRVRGLEQGGDDYLTKPFDFLELTARLDVLLRRRSAPQRQTMLRAGKLEMDLLTHAVRYAGRLIELLPREYRLLEFLMRHAGQVVTRTMLFEEVWNYRSVEPTNVIDMHISKLRRKLDPESSEPVIRTVRGAGYVLRASV